MEYSIQLGHKYFADWNCGLESDSLATQPEQSCPILLNLELILTWLCSPKTKKVVVISFSNFSAAHNCHRTCILEIIRQ